MSLPIPSAERRSGQVIRLSDFRPAPRPTSIVWPCPPIRYEDAARAVDMIDRDRRNAEAFKADRRAAYADDLGPWDYEPPLARQIALVEMGVITEQILFGAIVLPLPPARSPLAAAVRRLAWALAR